MSVYPFSFAVPKRKEKINPAFQNNSCSPNSHCWGLARQNGTRLSVSCRQGWERWCRVTPICKGPPVWSPAHFSSSCCCCGDVACCSDDFCWRSPAARDGRSSAETVRFWPGNRKSNRRKAVSILRATFDLVLVIIFWLKCCLVFVRIQSYKLFWF